MRAGAPTLTSGRTGRTREAEANSGGHRAVYLTEAPNEVARGQREPVRPLEHVVGILKPQLALSEYIGSIADDEVAVGKLARELVRRAKLGDEPALEAWTLRKLYGREFLHAITVVAEEFERLRLAVVAPDAPLWAGRRNQCSRRILVALSHGTLETTDQVRHLK